MGEVNAAYHTPVDKGAADIESYNISHISKKEVTMLWTIFVILLVLWALGLLTGTTMGGVIHALLVIAIIVILIQVFQGRRRV